MGSPLNIRKMFILNNLVRPDKNVFTPQYLDYNKYKNPYSSEYLTSVLRKIIPKESQNGME